MAEISLTGDQMLSVLEAVAASGPLNATETARVCGINRTVAHRLLTTLAQRSYVRRGEGGYSVGPAVLQLVQAADLDLRSIARPLMLKLAEETGETVVLHGIHNQQAVVIDQALGERHLVRVQHTPGSRHDLFQGASGWSILAFQPERTIANILKKVPSPETARERIAGVVRDGYALSHDELQQGVHGISAPLIRPGGSCDASIGILVPTVRAAALPKYVQPLLAVARQITAAARPKKERT